MYQRLTELLDYSPVTGIFRWKVEKKTFPFTKIGDVAGTFDRGYLIIKADGKNYRAHRLAWFFTFGVWPKELDHRNGDRADNRIDNLREATRSQNSANMRTVRVGLKGASWNQRDMRWQAHIRKDGKQYHLGCFRTEQEAHQAYIEGAKKLHGEFARAA